MEAVRQDLGPRRHERDRLLVADGGERLRHRQRQQIDVTLGCSEESAKRCRCAREVAARPEPGALREGIGAVEDAAAELLPQLFETCEAADPHVAAAMGANRRDIGAAEEPGSLEERRIAEEE